REAAALRDFDPAFDCYESTAAEMIGRMTKSSLCQKRIFALQQISYSMISAARARSVGGTVIFRPPRM
ncbi:MAG TPA: hypothetical protein VKB89_10040, partial [Xanthobacteraceae bacterium]|nr:hypothetical protein [Xanthobacteraceae bacterium]